MPARRRTAEVKRAERRAAAADTNRQRQREREAAAATPEGIWAAREAEAVHDDDCYFNCTHLDTDRLAEELREFHEVKTP